MTEPQKDEKIKPLQRAPFIKEGLPIPVIGNKREMGKVKSITDDIRAELEKPKVDTDKITKMLMKIDEKNGNPIEKDNVQGPILALIRENGNIEWFENVKSGILRITRSDGKTGDIQLRKNKLLNTRWGNKEVLMWVAHENEGNALPGNVLIDSKAAYQIIEEVMSNRKNLEAQTLKQWEQIGWMLIMGIIGLLVVSFIVLPLFTGKSLPEWLDKGNKTEIPVDLNKTIDANVIDMNKAEVVYTQGDVIATERAQREAITRGQ